MGVLSWRSITRRKSLRLGQPERSSEDVVVIVELEVHESVTSVRSLVNIAT